MPEEWLTRWRTNTCTHLPCSWAVRVRLCRGRSVRVPARQSRHVRLFISSAAARHRYKARGDCQAMRSDEGGVVSSVHNDARASGICGAHIPHRLLCYAVIVHGSRYFAHPDCLDLRPCAFAGRHTREASIRLSPASRIGLRGFVSSQLALHCAQHCQPSYSTVLPSRKLAAPSSVLAYCSGCRYIGATYPSSPRNVDRYDQGILI